MGRDAKVSILLTARNMASAVIDEVRGAVNKTVTAVQELGPASEKAAAKSKESFDGIKEMALKAGEAMGLLWSAHEVIEAADAWKMAEGQLRIVTGSTNELRGAQAQLFDIAQRTRTSFESNVMLYSRLTRSTRELHLSQQQLANVTEAVARAAMLSNGTTQQLENGYYQLGQALAVGKLQAQDARSIIEDLPRLGLAMAEGMGLSMGQFNAQMHEGKITAEAMVTALQKALPKLRDESAQIPLTVAQSMTQLKNAFQRYIGETDRGLGATSALAAGIGFLGAHMSAVGNVGFALLIAKASALMVAFGESTASSFAAASGLTAHRAAAAAAATAEGGLVLMTGEQTAMFGAEAVAAAEATVVTEGFAVGAGIAAVASRALGTALSFAGGWIGVLIGGVILAASWLLNLRNSHKQAAEAQRAHADEIARANQLTNEESEDIQRQIDAIEKQRAALRKGGLAAADAAKDEATAYDKAAQKWKQYKHDHEDAKNSALSFKDALKAGDQVARGYLASEDQLMFSTRKLNEEMKAATKAAEAQKKADDPKKVLADQVSAIGERIGIERELVDMHDNVSAHLAGMSGAEDIARLMLKNGNITLKERLELLKAIDEAVKERQKNGLVTPEEAFRDPRTGKVKAPPPLTGDPTSILGPNGPKAAALPAEKAPSIAKQIGGSIHDALTDGAKLNEIIGEMASHTFQEFGNAVEGAFEKMGQGSHAAGDAFKSAMIGAIAVVAESLGQLALGKATLAFGDGLLGDPKGFAAAAEYGAAATLLFALSGTIKAAANRASGSGGGGAAASATSSSLNDAASQKGDASLIIEGGFLNMNDPAQADALANALTALSGRRVTIKNTQRS